MQKGFLLVWILVGVLMGGIILFTAIKLKPLPTPLSQSIPTSTPIDASPAPTGAGEAVDWKTYTNKTYGFSVKYPSELEVENKSSQFPPLTIFITDKTKQVLSEGGSKTNPYAFVEIKSGILSLMDYVNDTKNNLEYIDKKKIGEIEFIIAREKFGMAAGNFDRYLAQNRDYIITIANLLYHGLDEQIFNQILSTFKFLE